jgi:D-glucosaminate-specific PTS system IIB component
MGVVTMSRVDFRLVHGQVAGTWIKQLAATKIIILCDEVGNDPFMVEMFNLAAPPGCEIIAYPIEKGVEEWKKDQFGDGRLIVLFRYIASAKKAYECGFEFESLDIGQVPGAPDRKWATNTVSLSQVELRTLEEFAQKGIKVYFQAVPYEKATDLSAVSQKMKF